MKNFINIIVLSCLSLATQAQQLSNASLMPGAQARINPAYVAHGDVMQFDGFFRLQWVGFTGAPAAGFVSAQVPFKKLNMGTGAILHFDNTGPISKVGLSLNYAYKLKEIIGRRDQLSLGLSADIQQYSFNGSGQIVNDEDDIFLGRNQSSIFPSLGIGAYYMSTTRMFKENMFFTGLSTNQVFATDVLINNVDQNRERHYNMLIGGRFMSYDSYIEPMISANVVKPDIINVLYGLRYEKEDTFWAGVGYESAGVVGFQGGVILTNLGENQDGTMRIGALSNFGMSSGLNQTGATLEFYMSYAMAK